MADPPLRPVVVAQLVARTGPQPAPVDFSKLPAPDYRGKEAQRRDFVGAHGGPEAEADFERWWEAHTVRVSGGFRTRWRVQWLRMRLIGICEARSYWRAAMENVWERVEFADERRARPHPDARWRPER